MLKNIKDYILIELHVEWLTPQIYMTFDEESRAFNKLLIDWKLLYWTIDNANWINKEGKKEHEQWIQRISEREKMC